MGIGREKKNQQRGGKCMAYKWINELCTNEYDAVDFKVRLKKRSESERKYHEKMASSQTNQDMRMRISVA